MEAVVRRRKRSSDRSDVGPARGRRARDPRRPVPGLRRRPQHRPHAQGVRAARAARPGAGQGAPARGDLPGGLGLRDGARRSLGGRLRAQAAPEARDRLARLELHPHAFRRGLPLPARAPGRRRRGRRVRGAASASSQRAPAPAAAPLEEFPPDPEAERRQGPGRRRQRPRPTSASSPERRDAGHQAERLRGPAPRSTSHTGRAVVILGLAASAGGVRSSVAASGGERDLGCRAPPRRVGRSSARPRRSRRSAAP